MPVTFATYAIGMMALSGVPLLFSGFWSKDEILHAAHNWNVSHVPFYLGLIGALLTAFYMTRQVFVVFFGNCRLHLGKTTASEQRTVEHAGVSAKEHPHSELPDKPHESPLTMTVPLILLAACSILLGFIGTPASPWFQRFLGHEVEGGFTSGVVALMIDSSAIVLCGIALGYWFYGRKPAERADEPDPLQRILWPELYRVLERKYYIDEIYERTVIAFNAWWSRFCDFLEFIAWNGAVKAVSVLVTMLSVASRLFDEYVVNGGFDGGCAGVSLGGRIMSRLQSGRVQNYLRVIGVALVVLVIWLIWGGAK
jgi:NADH-quinone oxidoreductase subunit L